MRFEEVIFDIDGVVVASPHERAWRDSLEALMATEWRGLAAGTCYAPERFTTAVYQQEIAGKPRELGARAALEYFGVPDAAARARRYAERKQETLLRLLEARDFSAFHDAVRLLLTLKARCMAMAAASSSKNANLFLGRIHVTEFSDPKQPGRPPVTPGMTLLDLFDVSLSGGNPARGKPAPYLYLAAAMALDVPADRCLVVEDAPAGIQAAKAAGMAALGVARLDDQALLVAAGADQVVTSLDEIDVDALIEGRLEARAA